jgi:hypothetical protein
MKVSVETCEPKVTLELSAREAQVVEQALFLVEYTGTAFSNDVADINAHLGNALDSFGIELLSGGTR